MWDKACDQLRRHTGRLLGTGGSARESIGVSRLAHPGLLGGDLFSATRNPTSYQYESISCSLQLIGLMVMVLLAIASGGNAHEGVEFKDHLLICARFSCSGLALKVGQSHVVSPRRRPWMPYAIVATT